MPERPALPELRAVADAEGRLSLPWLLKQAVLRHPSLSAAREASAAAREKRAQVTALPDPMLKLGWYAESIETRTGPQDFVIGLTQNIPWPAKLAVAGDIADLESYQAKVREWVTARTVLSSLTRNYHELNYLLQADRASAELETLWADLVARAAGTWNISAAEIARAETRLAQVRYDRLVLNELAEVERERIRAALALPATLAVGRPRDIVLPELGTSLAELNEATLKHNQDILLATLGVEASRAREDLATLSRLPDFSIGGRYVVTDERSDATPIGNGDDPLIVELGIKIPLQQGARSARIAQARHKVAEASFRRQALVESLRGRLADAFFRASNEARLIQLYEDTLLPQAERAAREAEAVLESGQGGLAGLIETIAARHQVRLGLLRARADYAIRLTRIEEIIGAPLGRVSQKKGDDK